MSISFFGLDIAMTGMAANQKALEVVGHNIANLGTDGYARQGAILVGAATKSYGNWRIEMGVDVQEIRQIRDLFQDNLVRSETNSLGYWETRYKAVDDLQAIIGEPMKDGLQSALNQFWDSWQELSKAPESLTIRSLVRQRADSLVQYVNHIGSQLDKLQADLNTEISRRIDEVNEITSQVAKLNIKIASAEAGSNKPNDYYDQRNTLVDRLSELVTVDTNVTPDGQMDLIVGGYFLVAKGVQTELVAASNGLQSQFYTPKLAGYDVEVDVGQGIIKGLLEGRGEVSGVAGSSDNGSPNTLAEVTVMLDTAHTTAAQQADIAANTASIIAEMQKHGLQPVVNTITYDGTEADLNAKITAYSAASAVPAGANRFLLLASDENIGGDGTVANPATVSSWAVILKNKNVNVSILSNQTDYDTGDVGESGWKLLSDFTDGHFYDLTDFSANPSGMMTTIGSDASAEVDTRMATDVESSNIVSSARRQLNALLSIMMREVNYLHTSGTTLNGLAGQDLFVQATVTVPLEMGNIKLNSNLTDTNNLVAGRSNTNGDNTIALGIANLRNEMLMTGRHKALSLDTYYQNIILQIGNKGFDAESIMNNQKSLVEQADAIRQSIMGVSLDEEMGNMIKFKYAYNAASKNIKVIDEMIDTIINRTGAGRT